MEKKSIINRMWDKFKEDPVYSIWFILGLVEVVVTLVVLIVGIVNFRTTGYYIPGDTAFGDDANYYVSQEKFNFLKNMLVIQVILSLVEGLKSNFKRTAAVLLASVVFGILTVVNDILALLLGLGLLYVIFRLYTGTKVGWMTLITFILYELFFNGTPLILNIQQYPGKAILIIVLVVVIVFIVGGDICGPTSSYVSNDNSAPSRSSYSDTRDINKNQNEIDRLKRKNEELKNAIEKHNRGDIGYFYVDNKVTQRAIEKNEERIKNLEK